MRKKNRQLTCFEPNETNGTARTPLSTRGNGHGRPDGRHRIRWRRVDAPLAAIASSLAEIAEVKRFERQRRTTMDDASRRKRAFFAGVREPIVTVRWALDPPEFFMAHRALDAYLRKWTALEPCADSGGVFAPARQLAFEIAPGKWDLAPLGEIRFWTGPRGQKLCVESEEESRGDFHLHFVVPRSLVPFVRGMWPWMKEWSAKNHYLRGRKITADHDFLELGSEDAWDSLVLAEPVKRAIAANTFHLLERRPAYKAAGVPLRRGVLLHGPPGTGKTMIGRALAQSCDCTFILVTASMIHYGCQVRHAFELARRLAPTILFFEDLDLVGADRHTGVDKEILGELLSGLDGINATDGVITVATTNDLTAIEPALKERPSRFDLVLEVPLFDSPERREYLTCWLAANPGAAIDTDRLVEATRGFTGAQMQELCRSATIAAIERLAEDELSNKPVVTQADFLLAIERLKKRARAAAGFHAER